MNGHNATFEERSRLYLGSAAAAAKGWYDSAGNWTASSKPAKARESFWTCCALYAADENALADAVILAAPTDRGHLGDDADSEFDIFHSNIAVVLLTSHGAKMGTATRAKLERLARGALGFRPGDRQPDYQFHGYNDNMPAKAAMGLILGGEMLGDPDAVRHGVWSLRRFAEMLARRGINSEWNSPTYTPVTIHALAEIAENAQDEEARRLALQIEHRLWIDLAARFHSGVGILSGPYSRAYTIDFIGSVTSVSSLLWFVLGDVSAASPMRLFEPSIDFVAHHEGDIPFNIAQMCWFAAGSYHIPDQAMELLASDRRPQSAVATFEHGAAGVEWPATSGRITTYQQADYSVGTSSAPFLNGEQTAGYFVTYRKTEQVRGMRDVGTVYAKMLVDEDLPGPLAGSGGVAGWVERDHVPSRSNWITLQSGPTALVVSHPHLSLGGAADTSADPVPIRRLSEVIVFPSHYGGADEILTSTLPEAGRALQRLDSWSGELARGSWLASRRGRLLIGIRPLGYSRTLGPVGITLEKTAHYEFLRVTYYDGTPRTFTREEMRHFFGGFVAEHASVSEFPSLAAFAEMLARSRFTDFYWLTRRVRYLRPASEIRAALEMETSWSPGTPCARYAAVDGHQVKMPKVAIDGVDAAELPLRDPLPAEPWTLPWPDRGETVYPDWPFAVGDSG